MSNFMNELLDGFKPCNYCLRACVCGCVCMCACVHACMPARVWVCVCLYSFTVKASSVCNDILDIIEGTDQRSCVVSIMLCVFAKFLDVRI